MPGFVFYEGPSLIDGQPIVGIATYGTKNAKTGDLVQTWIMRSDVNPLAAASTGADQSICGSCPLRGRIEDSAQRTKKSSKLDTSTVNRGRGCYVPIQNAPRQIYASYRQGAYPQLTQEGQAVLAVLSGRGLRYGSYGDPVAIPIKHWDRLLRYCTGKAVPGYTHQWRNRKFARWSKRIMASTHSFAENQLAQAMGWRTFRTLAAVTELANNEFICPASLEGGARVTCENCGACNGRRDASDVRHSVAIVAHGGPAQRRSALRAIEAVSKSPLPIL